MKSCKRLLVPLLLLTLGMQAHAGFTISGTRVIYHEAQGEATVHLQHITGNSPVLLQTWLDDGTPKARPGTQNLPFILTPAVVRVDPGQAQVVRILRLHDDLPQDRESLLFFNALEIPISASAQRTVQDDENGENHLQLAMQARMKFFYRPRKFKISPLQAPDLLTFALKESTGHDALHLHIHNPTPYHLTLPNLALRRDGAATDTPALAELKPNGVAPMVTPFSDLAVALAVQASTSANTLVEGALAAPDHLQVHYTVINDQGGLNSKQKNLGNVAA